MRHRTPLVKFGLPDHPPDVAPIRKDKEAEKATTRKKGLGVRTWLAIDEKGETKIIEAGKHAIMHRTFLPARDLRILDPLLSYPSTILGREHAIVVNLEHIKAIITANEVLLLNSKDPLVTPFVHDLQKRLPVHYNALGQQVPADGGGATSDNEIGSAGGLNSSPGGLTTQDRSGNGNHAFVGGSSVMDHPLTKFQEPTHVKPGAPTVLPFEFRALESCLEAACSCLDAETNALEEQAYPALDELTSKISTLNLERVRQIKSRLVTISGRVQKVRDEIEQLLDDDGDMAEMYLTDKLMRQELDSPSSPAILAHVDEAINPEIASVSSDSDEDRPLLGAEERENQNVAADNIAETRYLENIPSLIRTDINNMSNRTSTTSSSSSSNRSKHLNVEELEMLLEAYFVQIEGTLNKLSTLKEYVDDTEDYINIMLDDKQNHLLQMAVMLTTATLVVSAFIVVTGLFGMNIHISLFDTGTMVDFLWVVGGTAVGAFFIYFGVIGWCKWKRLLE